MKLILDSIKQLEFSSISGVPDSTLSELIAVLDSNDNTQRVHVTPNEGSAIALAVGSYLGLGKPGLVYLQNSGMGNALNPLASLAHIEVYAIPMVLIIGWRGAISDDGEQLPDEPQHLIQGFITQKQLKDLSIPFKIANNDLSEFAELLEEMYSKTLKISGPVAILVRPGLFDERKVDVCRGDATLESKEVISKVLSISNEDSIFVGSTGMISRELLQVVQDDVNQKDLTFLNIGAMGHASMIAKGIALTLPTKTIICFDGDGSLAMHLGSLSVLNELSNFKLIILNNHSHDSVGGQRTSFGTQRLEPLLNFFSNGNYTYFHDLLETDLVNFQNILASAKFEIVEIECKPRSNQKLPRPTESPQSAENRFRKRITSKT